MKERGAILNNKTVYTDSSYFFYSDVTRIFLQVFESIAHEFNCELDCYGDFLQPLGLEPFRGAVVEKSQQECSTVELVRSILTSSLKHVKFYAIKCEESKFYHIGTMREYIEHFSSLHNDTFMNEINGTSNSFSL